MLVHQQETNGNTGVLDKFYIMKNLIFLFLIPLIGFGQKCISGDCENGYGTYIYGNGNKYIGEWKNNQRNGQRLLNSTNSDIYSGSWTDGIREGMGRFNYANGNRYIGQFKYGEWNGQGTYSSEDPKYEITGRVSSSS